MEIIEWYHELKYIQYIKDTRVTEEPAIIDDYLDPIMTNLRVYIYIYIYVVFQGILFSRYIRGIFVFFNRKDGKGEEILGALQKGENKIIQRF